jgi:Ca-activated chloride channel homolog
MRIGIMDLDGGNKRDMALIPTCIILVSAGLALPQPSRVVFPRTAGPVQSRNASAGANAIRLKVSVTDEKGRSILALKKEDFLVSVEKAPETIEYFSQADAPASICVVYDHSGSTRAHQAELTNVADDLLPMVRGSNPGSEFCIVAFSDQAKILMDWKKDRK